MSFNADEIIMNSFYQDHYTDVWQNIQFESASKATTLSFIFWTQYPEILNQYLINISHYSIMTMDDLYTYKDIYEFNWNVLSSRPDFTWEMIQLNNTLPWTSAGISENTNITWDIVSNNLSFDWNWETLAYNIGITESNDYEAFLTYLHDNYPNLWPNLNIGPITQNTHLSFQFWLNFPGMLIEPNFIRNICLFSVLSIEEIIEYKDEYPFYWDLLSMRDNMTLSIINDNPSLPWEIEGLSQNPNLSWIYITDNLNLEWNWYSLCYNKALVESNDYESLLNYVYNEKYYIWNMLDLNQISQYSSLSLSFWLQFPETAMLYVNNISALSIVSIDDYHLYKDTFNFNMVFFSSRVNITWEIVLANQDIPWDFSGLSWNPNISLSTIYENITLPWNFVYILNH